MARPLTIWNGRWRDNRGTLCCLVRRTNGVPGLYVLGASHVLAPPGAAEPPAVGDPVFCDLDDDQGRQIATLSAWNPLVPGGETINPRDAAIARVDATLERRLLEVADLPTGASGGVVWNADVTIGGAVSAEGGPRKTKITGTRASDAVFQYDYADGSTRLIGYAPDSVFTTNFVTRPGDSGCAVLDNRGRIVGMLIGGSTESNRSYFGDIQRALSFFSLTVVTSADASEPHPSTVPVSRPTGVVPGAVLAVPPVRDTSTARDILARTLWGEARGEGREGITGVASVVVNRASRGASYWWGGTIEDVCRKPWQFSCWNQHDPNRRKLLQVTSGDAAFNICLEVADAAVNGRLQDVTFGSTHYHDFSVHPTWAHNRSPCIRVGKLIFYNNVEPLR